MVKEPSVFEPLKFYVLSYSVKFIFQYIVPHQRLSDGDCDSLLDSVSLDSSDEEEASNFRELFSLPVEESPLQGG